MNITELLNNLVEGHDLKSSDTEEFLEQVIRGELTDAQIAAVLTALRIKGESSEEIVGLLRSMRRHMLSVQEPDAIDVVGTGGDGSGTFNISTVAALVAVGAGARVGKHGNRAASGKCGSSDVLEALGVNVHLTAPEAKEVLQKAGMVFLFAPLFHPATKRVVAVRKELKIRTIFNILGPFANPAETKRQLIGVPNADIAKKMASVAKSLDYKHLIIVASEDGMDEISLSAKTLAFEIRGTSVKKFTIDPKKFGFKKSSKSDILGGDAGVNVAIVRDILLGTKGPRRDIVVLNAAFALYVAGIAKTPKEGIALAEKSIDEGKASAALERLIKETRKFSQQTV